MSYMYRALPKAKTVSDKLITPHSTMRPPGNVPYVVDNLWEWIRPQNYPNRRYAAFAIPDPELAMEAVGGECNVYRVEFPAWTSNTICKLIQPEEDNFEGVLIVPLKNSPDIFLIGCLEYQSYASIFQIKYKYRS